MRGLAFEIYSTSREERHFTENGSFQGKLDYASKFLFFSTIITLLASEWTEENLLDVGTISEDRSGWYAAIQIQVSLVLICIVIMSVLNYCR